MTSSRPAKPSSRRRVVLLVDDEASYREMLIRWLVRLSGIEVLDVKDALAAIRVLERRDVDLVVSDLSMPGPDGEMLLETVGARWPQTRRLLVTGHGNAELVASAAYPVLQKGAVSTSRVVDTIVQLARS
jgi:DNA-binding NtrC family response regulator